MTTNASPDGQTTATETAPNSNGAQSNPDGGGGDPEAWRNSDDVKRIIAKRDEYKTQNADLLRRLADLEQRSTSAQRAKDEADGNIKGLLDSLKAENDSLKAGLAESTTRLSERDRKDKRRDFTDVVLSSANPQHRDELRHMLAGLHEDGEIDLYAEDTKTSAQKAVEKLAKRFPDKFGSADPTAGGTASGARTSVPDNVPLEEMPLEVVRAMSDEDFAKRYGAGKDPKKGMAI